MYNNFIDVTTKPNCHLQNRSQHFTTQNQLSIQSLTTTRLRLLLLIYQHKKNKEAQNILCNLHNSNITNSSRLSMLIYSDGDDSPSSSINGLAQHINKQEA